MKTSHKIALAKAAYQVMRLLRSLIGQGDRVVARRRGLSYDLDLSEGIDFAIFVLGRFEPWTMHALETLVRPGWTVLDIGANVGAHTIPLARLVGPSGRVIAFEPTKFAFEKLKRNFALNPTIEPRSLCLQYFLGPVGSQNAPDHIYSSWPLTDGKEVHEIHCGDVKETTGATSRDLDSVLKEHAVPRVDLVKMDVDGFECDVLAGAMEMLRRDKPIFVMELAPYALADRGASLDQLMSYFRTLNYRLFDERSGAPIADSPEAMAALVADGASRNIIARAT